MPVASTFFVAALVAVVVAIAAVTVDAVSGAAAVAVQYHAASSPFSLAVPREGYENMYRKSRQNKKSLKVFSIFYFLIILFSFKFSKIFENFLIGIFFAPR